MMSKRETLGLIAGNGKFPILFAHNARRQNIPVKAVGIKGDTSLLLRCFVDKLFWVGPGELRKLFKFFKNEGIRKVIMAGQVNPNNLFDQRVKPDDEFQKLFMAMKDRKADTIFHAIAERLKTEGLELMDSTALLKDYLADQGTLTRRGPTEKELEDISFGQEIAKAMGSLDVGQTVVVKEKAILAIEAMEGTDQAILRGGRIAKTGVVVIKVSKPKQDHRFDVPVVGPKTIKNMIRIKAACLAIEAGKTLIIDEDQCIKLANRAKICIVAV
ncbi:MAG: UDP-2,3-diacylglucosamine diphosphatase LpxI [Candidatus Omnitrophota bacterium]